MPILTNVILQKNYLSSNFSNSDFDHFFILKSQQQETPDDKHSVEILLNFTEKRRKSYVREKKLSRQMSAEVH